MHSAHRKISCPPNLLTDSRAVRYQKHTNTVPCIDIAMQSCALRAPWHVSEQNNHHVQSPTLDGSSSRLPPVMPQATDFQLHPLWHLPLSDSSCPRLSPCDLQSTVTFNTFCCVVKQQPIEVQVNANTLGRGPDHKLVCGDDTHWHDALRVLDSLAFSIALRSYLHVGIVFANLYPVFVSGTRHCRSNQLLKDPVFILLHAHACAMASEIKAFHTHLLKLFGTCRQMP
jgi:hypothetical protein